MKKRVLSVILAFGIILSNFYSGLAVIAEDAEAQQETVTEENQPVDEPLQNGENDVIELNFVFEDDFPDLVYYGQDEPKLAALREENSFLPKYYHLEYPDKDDEIPDDVYEAFFNSEYYSLEYVTDYDYGSEGDTLYRIEVKPKEQEQEPIEVDGVKYSVNMDNTELNRTFTVMKYIPEHVEVSLNIDKDGTAWLETNDERFFISQSLDADSFKGTKIQADINNDGTCSYYLMNVDNSEENDCYHAISGVYSIDANKPMVNNEAEISTDSNDFDIKKGAYNASIEVTLSGEANSENAVFYLYNGKEKISNEIIAEAELNQGSGQYKCQLKAKCNIELPSDKEICYNKLSAKIKADGRESDITPLRFKKDNEFADGFVLENIPPKIEYNEGAYDSNVIYFTAEDKESSIDKVKINIGDEIITPESTGNNGSYKADLSSHGDGDVSFEIIAIDKAGNQNSITRTKNIDSSPPEIGEISYEYLNEGTWVPKDNKVLYVRNYGVFSREKVRIAVEATDESGISRVELYNGNVLLKSTTDSNGNTFCFEMDDCSYNDLNVIAVDNYEHKSEPTTIGKFVVGDKEKPTCSFEHPNHNKKVDSEIWYGLDTKNESLVVNAEDDKSGIAKVDIRISDSKNKTTPVIEIYDSYQTKTKIELPIEKYFKTDGSYEITVTVTDNSGNEDVKTLLVNTDFNAPKGTVDISDTSKDEMKIIDGKFWFDLGISVEFAFKSNDAYSVEWTIDSTDEKPGDETNGDLILSDKDEKNIISTGENGPNVGEDWNHKYTVKAKFYDKAGNASKEQTIEVYKDLDAPAINSVTASKVESGTDRVLRILSFGLFSNDKIKITVNASDEKYDSGLDADSAMIAVKEDAKYPDDYYKMDYDSQQKNYSAVIPKTAYTDFTETAMTGEVALRVTDKFGKYTEEFKGITSDGTVEELEKNPKKFMIEQIKPSVMIIQPNGDGEERTDNTIWYNSDKDIAITVRDKDSGINNISVSVNNESVIHEDFTLKQDTASHEYHLSTDQLVVSFKETNKLPQDGHYIVEVDVEDNAGNHNIQKIDYYIDKEAPKVESIDFSIPSADNFTDASQFIDILEYGFYFKTELIATVNVSDEAPSSGLHRIEYNLVEYNNGVKGKEKPGTALINENGHASFKIPNNFKGQIFVKGFDYVGNKSDEKTPQSFVVDTPERHDSEEHIEITGMGETGYRDAEGNLLYNSDVNFTVRISDTISGIRDISYSVSSEQNSQDVSTINIDNTGNTMGQNLGDGWIIAAMDENLVTEVRRSYTFSADDNDIQLSFAMTDRANNKSEKMSDTFSVDQTAPVIDVVFDSPAGNNEYYRENRTATITVIERNFDPSRIIASITNEIGSVPGLSFTSNSNKEHVATLTFGEGDYTFSIEGTDLCDHTALVSYSGGNERKFYVDMTDPKETDNFEQFINDLENSFKNDKEMTFKITEHNFVPSLVNIKVYRTKAGQELTVANREDCTSEFISANKWTDAGDTHTLSIKFTKDYVYQVTISVTDASGRVMAEKSSPIFEIDKTAPVLKTPANLDVLVFTSKNTEKSATPIKFSDNNIASIHYSVVSYQMKVNEDNVGYDMKVDSDEFDVKSDSVVISNEFFNQDGIYEVKCVAYDVAGNPSEETTHTFVIQRDTDFLVYIPNSNKNNHTGLYKFDKTGIRSADFEDIEIITYITKDKKFEVQVDGAEVTGSDLDVAKDERRINQVDMYDVTLKSSYIAQNYNADTIDTDLMLNAVAVSDDKEQVITLGHIYIDNVKPVGEYEAALQNIGTFDGFYGVESRTVMIEGVSPDIDLERCEIQTNDTVLQYDDGGFDYDEDAHTISFSIEKGYTDIRPTLVDNAGNINNLPIIKKVYVGGLFARWWYLFILGGLSVIAIPASIVIKIVRKKKTGDVLFAR